MREWYWFKRGGWEIAVDAVSHQDARQHIAIHAPGAEYQGVWQPSNYPRSVATAMTTSKRQAQISGGKK